MRLLRWLRRIIRPQLTILNIYDLERETTHFAICHREELAANFFAPSPLFERIMKANKEKEDGK